MNVKVIGKNIEVEISDFLLSQTLECGQCFHFVKLGEEEYKLVTMDECLHVSQKGNILTFHNVTIERFENRWRKYFDLDTDYASIKKFLAHSNPELIPAIESMWGVRLLNQDFFETLISFIISQNQQIPRIKAIVANLSREYGIPREMDMYSFPDERTLLKAGEAGISRCKAGFRTKYILDACEKYMAGQLSEEYLMSADYETVMTELKKIKGVGDKVANCVALFSLGKRNAFPVDVWIQRIMEHLYFEGPTSKEAIELFAKNRFGEYGGYAQQYLFYYAKENGIGKN